MDNGALVFIIFFEAVAIVWLLSKLKQYENFEDLIKKSNRTDESSSQAIAKANHGNLPEIQSGNPTPGFADDLLQVPGVEPEINIEEAKRVQLVMARCRYAEFYLEQLDDDYERGQFKQIVNSAIVTARSISDPFFKANALHPVITLLDRAGWEEIRDELIAEVEDEHVIQQINDAIGAGNVEVSS